VAVLHHNPAELFPRYANYSHAVEVRGDTRLLFISGLNGYLPDGKTMPLTQQAEGSSGAISRLFSARPA
jgi:2-iminobutanoate/2-iminopropanoate deaminase